MTISLGKTVLVVEDERVVAKDLQRTLISFGYDVPLTAASADDAIRAASERCPDLVLMDIRIKGDLDGIQTAEILRSRFDVPVVYLTAYADDATVERAKKTEPHAYLLKPVKADELRSAVQIALYKHDADRRLHERERWFATTLRSIGDAVISTDATGHITFMNPVAETLTGYTTQQVHGRPLSDILKLLDSTTKAAIDDPIERVLRTGKIVEMDGRLITREGQERVIADSAAPIRDEQGTLLGVVVVLHDVSEARRLQRKLEFAERLASLGTLVAGVAHEINNPLAVIVSNLDFALQSLAESAAAGGGVWLEEVKDALREAQAGAGRVTQIVSDLRFFSRPTTEHQIRTDVNRTLQTCLDMLAHELRPRAQVTTDFQDVSAVLANETRLSQVFVNLLLNAAHALDETKAKNEIRVRTMSDGAERIIVEVVDTGRGMTDDVIQKMFDPFFTTKDVGQGTGLGLSICHGIVKSLGGEIQVESVVGTGSCLRVVLPAAPPEALPPALEVARGAPGASSRILVVEDEALVRKTILRTLGADHQLTMVEGAPEALALIESGKRFDVILCDLMMPRVTGMELHNVLLERCREQANRMLFVSGGAFVPEAVSFLSAMETRHLEKPFSPMALRDKVEDMLRQLGPI
jgi:two-component system, cell cycle sensor histidine kinase and response regulator CckA